MYRDSIFSTSYNRGKLIVAFIKRYLMRIGKIFQRLAVSHADPAGNREEAVAW
jgi:hypothetical protein